MTTTVMNRYNTIAAVLGSTWTPTDAPAGTLFRTWLHDSYRWAVVLCLKGESAGQVRVAEMDEGGRAVSRETGDWFTCPPEDLWLRLWESGAPDITRPAAEAVTAA